MAGNAAPSSLDFQRSSSSFDPDELLTLLAGGQKHVQIKNAVENQIVRDPVSLPLIGTLLQLSSHQLLAGFSICLTSPWCQQVRREAGINSFGVQTD
jgi:hypothetical protein